MARPLKTGLDYFPLDCKMDSKIEALECEFGLEGFAIYIKALQEIYQTLDGELKMEVGFSMWKILGKRWNIPPDKAQTILEYCCKIDLFDVEALKNGILTSNGVKKRIDEINQQRRADRERKFSSSFPLDNVRKSTQSKGKEIKSKVYIHSTQKIEFSTDFNNLWITYPKKVGKDLAFKRFKQSVRVNQDLLDIKKALDNYLKSERVYKGFIKNGDSWFHTWRDWITYTEDVCNKCHGAGKFVSSTGYETKCDCPKGKAQ